MNFVKSLFLGYEGKFHIFGQEVNFKKAPNLATTTSNKYANLAIKTLNSSFSALNLQHLHIFTHEMGHGCTNLLIDKISTYEPLILDLGDGQILKLYQNKGTKKIDIFISGLGGGLADIHQHTTIKKTLALIAGPMADVALSSIQLISASALNNYLPQPITFVLKYGALGWMLGEVCYVISSGLGGWGDGGEIAHKGATPFLIATSALIGECALGIFAAMKFT